MAQSLTERINELRKTPVWKLKKPGQHTTRLELEDLDRRWKALDYRKQGWSYNRIAKEMHLGVTTVREDILWCLDQVISEPAEEVRKMELERLDELQAAIWQRAIGGDYVAIDRVLRIMDKRQRILGIETPVEAFSLDFILQMATEISEQLGIPVEDIVAEAEFLARRAWIEGQQYDAENNIIDVVPTGLNDGAD